MAKTCMYCGAELAEGQACGCAGAQQLNAQPAEEAGAQTQPGAVQQQVANLQEKLKSVDSQALLSGGLSVFFGVIKDPEGTCKKVTSLQTSTSGVLLGAQAISVTLLYLFYSLKIYFALPEYYRGSFPIGSVFQVLLMAAVEIGLLFGALLLFGKLFDAKLSAPDALATVAIASPLWTASFLVTAVLSLILGITGIMGALYMALFTFTQIYSFYLLDLCLRQRLKDTRRRMLTIALAYAVHSLVLMALAGTILQSNLQSALMGFSF